MKNEWIPTCVTLPKETKIGVWLTLQRAWGRQVVHGQWCLGRFKHVNGKEIDIDTVVAWKPLEYPEPYMGPILTMDVGYGTIDTYPIEEQDSGMEER